MAEKITPRSKDFSEWYHDVVLQSKMADYSPVKGCMVIRPNGYAVWENIQKNLDARIKATGAKNAYFPLLIPESFLKKEADHVEGFAPQCAVVTYAGSKDLEEKLVIRPTSETIINSMFAKWIQSYRDLPMMINQWANVVRWEMRTRLFLRTTEFLWQEGHTCHATLEEAELEARQMLQVYTRFAEEILAMPVIPGLKSDSEKFAGALRTYCIEGMMQDTKSLQAGTSHNLSDHFAKAFNTLFLDKDSKQKHVFQTSWGVSTRLIGGVIMTHADDKGLVLPPRLAAVHVVIVPFLGKPDLKSKVIEASEKLAAEIRDQAKSSALPYTIAVDVDTDENKQAGWKFYEYELLGVPIRIELGPRDLDKGQILLVRRDQEGKREVPIGEAAQTVIRELGLMQTDLLEKARKFRDANTHDWIALKGSYADFQKSLDERGGFYIAGWCQSKECESKIKEETKATIRCLALDEAFKAIATPAICLGCGGAKENLKAIFARSY